MTIVPECEVAAAKAKAKTEAQKEIKQGKTSMTLGQCLKRKYSRIAIAYAYAVPEDSAFYDLAESLQEQWGVFRTCREEEMATRRSLTTDTGGRDLTQKAWKDKIVALTSTVEKLEQTIESLESENKRQKLELDPLREKQDWELQEDGTVIIVDRSAERELERNRLAYEADEMNPDFW